MLVLALGIFRAYRTGRPKPLWVTIQVFAILGALAGWFYVRTSHYLAGLPDGDLYAQTWGFQGIVFALLYLPCALLLSGVLLLWQSGRGQ